MRGRETLKCHSSDRGILFSAAADSTEMFLWRWTGDPQREKVLMQITEERISGFSREKMENKEKRLLNLEKGKSLEARGDVCRFYGHRGGEATS